MSPREEVTRDRLLGLLEAIGQRFHHPARLYLSGGEGLVWRGLRGATRDVDVSYDVAPEHHGAWIDTLRDLKERLSISIEEAQPGDFIPLPRGSESRATFLGRFGQVDVFLADPYAVCLSKLERGHAQDLEDVRSLLGAGVVEAGKLRRLFEEILPEYAIRRVRADPARFERMLESVLSPPDGA